MDGSPDLKYLQSSFTGHQTIYTTTYHHPSSDHMFAEGRRLLVTRMTQPHENLCYRSVRQLSTGASSNNISWSRRRLCWLVSSVFTW